MKTKSPIVTEKATTA